MTQKTYETLQMSERIPVNVRDEFLVCIFHFRQGKEFGIDGICFRVIFYYRKLSRLYSLPEHSQGLLHQGYIVYIQRGYECFEEKIRGIGGIIEKVDSEKEARKFKLKVS